MEEIKQTGTVALKRGLAQMLKGGVIMDVVTPEQAKIAEDAGACAVMALERVPADIRAHGGVARMSDPDVILRIMDAVTIPVMAKCRIVILWKHRCWKLWALTTLTSRKCSPRPTNSIMSTNMITRCRLCVAVATWARPCAASARARP